MRSIRGKNGLWSWLALIAVPAVVFGVLYAWPVLHLIRLSFAAPDQAEHAMLSVQIATYSKLLTDSYYLEVLVRTIRVSILTTIACAVLGYPISMYVVSSKGLAQSALLIILLLPLVTSVTVVAYGWLIMFGRNGVINSTLMDWGLINSPLKIMFTETAIVIGLVHVLAVFMILSVAASLQAINPSLVKAARSLGAGYWTAFCQVVLPLSLPGLRTGSLLVFSLSMSAYGIPALVGGPRIKVVSTLIYQQAISLLNWPIAAAMAVVLLVTTTGILISVAVFQRFKVPRRPGFGSRWRVKLLSARVPMRLGGEP